MTLLDLAPKLTYVRHNPPRPVRDFLGRTDSTGHPLLDATGLEAAGRAIRLAPLVVIGEWHREDGRIFLDYGVPTEYIESVTHFQATPEGRLRWRCPECESWGGKHAKSCGYER